VAAVTSAAPEDADEIQVVGDHNHDDGSRDNQDAARGREAQFSTPVPRAPSSVAEHARNASPPPASTAPSSALRVGSLGSVRVQQQKLQQPAHLPAQGAGLDLSALLQAQAVPVSEVSAVARPQVQNSPSF
jgi:hypothetical protein